MKECVAVLNNARNLWLLNCGPLSVRITSGVSCAKMFRFTIAFSSVSNKSCVLDSLPRDCPTRFRS